MGRRGPGQPGAGLPRPEEAERRGQPGQHGDHTRGRARHGRDHAPAGLCGRAPPLLVGAAVHPGDPGGAVPAGDDVRPEPRAQDHPAAGLGHTAQPGRDGPRGRLDRAGLGLLRRARLAADRRHRGQEPAHPAAVGWRVRAGLGGRLPAHPVPRRDRASRGRADRRALAGHAAGPGAGHSARFAGGHDGGRPGLGGSGYGDRTPGDSPAGRWGLRGRCAIRGRWGLRGHCAAGGFQCPWDRSAGRDYRSRGRDGP